MHFDLYLIILAFEIMVPRRITALDKKRFNFLVRLFNGLGNVMTITTISKHSLLQKS